MQNVCSFTRAWDEYVTAGVVSEHSRQLITSVLINTIARGAEEPEENEEPDASDIDDGIAPLVLKGSDFRHLLQRASAADGHENKDRTKKNTTSSHIT